MTHAYLAPSSASTWSKCHAYPSLSAGFPGSYSDAAREGTKAHEIAMAYAAFGGQFAAAGCDNAEMLDGARLYAEYLNSLGGTAVLERTVHIKWVHARCFGTPDAYVWHEDRRHLDVIDYKYGHGFVEVYENPQLFLYAVGILSTLGAGEGGFTVSLHVVQPRCYTRAGSIRKWEMPPAAFPKILALLQDSARAATSPDPKTTPGDHCRYCPARNVCPGLRKAAYSAIDYSDISTPHDITDAQVGLEVAWLREASRLLSYRLSGLEEHALSSIRSGKAIPGFRAESEAGRLEWADSKRIGELLGEKYRKPAEMLTPTQAIKAGLDADFVSAHADRKPGKVKLVPDLDARKYFS